MRHANKIGVLDSGVGGLSVLREIHRLLPHYPTIYFADQAHVPYGPQSEESIRSYSKAITKFLLAEGAGIIVLACHAASAASLHYLRETFPIVPFVGIEPAVKPAVEATKSGVVGVLTTQATANGKLYKSVLSRFAQDVRVITQITPELVEIVEQGIQNTSQGLAQLQHYIQPLIDKHADQIVLACTHFPFLEDQMKSLLNNHDITIVDPGLAVAKQVTRILPVTIKPSTDVANSYFTSGNPEAFKITLRNLLGINSFVQQINL